MVLAIIIITLSIAIILFGYIIGGNLVATIGTSITMIGLILFMLSTDYLIDDSIPSAMDVYRGKTTLKITYVDSVAVDSVVVFKEQ